MVLVTNEVNRVSKATVSYVGSSSSAVIYQLYMVLTQAAKLAININVLM